MSILQGGEERVSLRAERARVSYTVEKEEEAYMGLLRPVEQCWGELFDARSDFLILFGHYDHFCL